MIEKWVGEAYLSGDSTVHLHEEQLSWVISGYHSKCLIQRGDTILVVKWHGVIFSLINVYGLNQDHPDKFHECFEHLVDIVYDALNIGRDFNQVLDPYLDRSTLPTKLNTQVKSILKAYMEELGLVDPWCAFYPLDREYTSISPVHHNCSRIEYFLLSRSFLDNTSLIQISILHAYQTTSPSQILLQY